MQITPTTEDKVQKTPIISTLTQKLDAFHCANVKKMNQEKTTSRLLIQRCSLGKKTQPEFEYKTKNKKKEKETERRYDTSTYIFSY